MKASIQFESDDSLETLVDGAERHESLRLWRESEREDECVHAASFAQLVDHLGLLFQYLALSTTPRGMAMRTWAVLYAVRPDLIGQETIQAAADRFGVSQQRLCQQLDAFKRRTGFRYTSKVGISDSETNRMRIQAMARARSEKARRFRDRFLQMGAKSAL